MRQRDPGDRDDKVGLFICRRVREDPDSLVPRSLPLGLLEPGENLRFARFLICQRNGRRPSGSNARGRETWGRRRRPAWIHLDGTLDGPLV